MSKRIIGTINSTPYDQSVIGEKDIIPVLNKKGDLFGVRNNTVAEVNGNITVTNTVSGTVSGFQNLSKEFSLYLKKATKGIANGHIPLDANGKIESKYLNISGGLEFLGNFDNVASSGTIQALQSTQTIVLNSNSPISQIRGKVHISKGDHRSAYFGFTVPSIGLITLEDVSVEGIDSYIYVYPELSVRNTFDNQVATNDDGGVGGRFRFSSFLDPGTYTAEITTYRKDTFGIFTLNASGVFTGVGDNTPAINDSTGKSGQLYKVTVDADVDFGSGTLNLLVGDWIIHNGTKWEKIPSFDTSVTDVNGQTGNIFYPRPATSPTAGTYTNIDSITLDNNGYITAIT